eukprot:105613-Pelagomonas_calceolata.AAC.2
MRFRTLQTYPSQSRALPHTKTKCVPDEEAQKSSKDSQCGCQQQKRGAGRTSTVLQCSLENVLLLRSQGSVVKGEHGLAIQEGRLTCSEKGHNVFFLVVVSRSYSRHQ